MKPGVRTPRRPFGRARARALALGVGLVLAAGCASGPPKEDPRYRPAESLLEVVALLRRHVPDDTYRFEPALDYTGRNVYRGSLLRLENLEKVHSEALRAGTFDDVISFAKGRALERLRAYELAATSYRKAAERESPLRLDALRSASLCDALAESVLLAPTPEDLADANRVLGIYDARTALLNAILPDVEGTHYAAIVREEMERTDVARAGFLVDTRRLDPDGDVRALGAIQQLVVAHRESKNTNQHLLSLANLYAELTVEYVETHPPESLSFDPPRFEELVEAASRLYEAIANQDGATEKLEAARRLEAFLAFTLQVDRDRFSP